MLLIIFVSAKPFTMSWTELVYALGDLLQATFGILPLLGNLPNILFTLVIIGGLAYWLKELKNYREEAKRSGGIE